MGVPVTKPVEGLIDKPGGNPYPEILNPNCSAASIEKLAALPPRRSLDPESAVAAVSLAPATLRIQVPYPSCSKSGLVEPGR